MGRKKVSSTVVARARAVQKNVAAMDHLPGATAIAEDVAAMVGSSIAPVSEKDLANIDAPQNWKYYDGRGEWINTITGEVGSRPPGEALPAPAPVRHAPLREEYGDETDSEADLFALTASQLAAGIRLAVSEETGMVRSCPECGRRRLVTVPRNGGTYLVCADALAADPICNFYEPFSADTSGA